MNHIVNEDNLVKKNKDAFKSIGKKIGFALAFKILSKENPCFIHTVKTRGIKINFVS